MTFQISPCIHLVWPSTPKFSCEVDVRWLFKCHLTSMWDDIWKVYKGKILQIFIIWPWDIEEVTSNTKFSCNMTFQISPRVHLAWPSVPSHPCKMTFEKYIRGNLADIHHLALGHPRGNIYLDISHTRCMRDDFSNVILCGCEMRFEKYIRGNLADIHHLALGHRRGNIYSDISHARCMWDDFSNLTSCLSCVAKCPLHHTKVFTWDACMMTFQISPHIHLAWSSVPSTTPKFSHKMHARWLFKSHLVSILCGQVSPPPHQSSHTRCTWDDFSNLISHPSSMAKCPLHHLQSHLA